MSQKRCTPFTHEWIPGPGVDPVSGLRNVCSNCGVGRFDEARVYELEQATEKARDFLGTATTAIRSFRPLAHAARAALEYPVRAHDCPGFDCATCRPMGELERAYEQIADMVADADAEVAAAQKEEERG